jgi:hypothetical protein
MKAETNITPHVQKNTGHGIPRLLPIPGNNAIAGRKKTQATTAAAFVERRLRYECDVSKVAIRAMPPNDPQQGLRAAGVMCKQGGLAGSAGCGGWAAWS